MKRRPVVLALAILGLVVAPDLAGGQADGRARLEGVWQLDVPAARAERIRDAAVDRAVGAMSFFVRSIARGRLREGSPIDRRIELRFEGDRVTARFGTRSTYTTRLGRTEWRDRADGSRVRVTQRWGANGQLEQVFQGDGGTRWFVYGSTGEGRLRLDVTTDSDRMPEAMRYSLPYARR